MIMGDSNLVPTPEMIRPWKRKLEEAAHFFFATIMPPTAAPPVGSRRILRSSPSMASLASSLSSISIYTTTSSKTAWGPGTLTGRAILALGKAAIRGAERVVIAKRISIMRSHLPCLEERAGPHTSFMDGVFDDLVELSRPELYSDSIRIPAMELILTQISSGHTSYLINSLSAWLLEDIILLVKEIVSVSMFCKCGFMEPSLVNAYVGALPESTHPLVPSIEFITKLAQQNDTTFEAVIHSNFLDLVLLTASQGTGVFDQENHSSLALAFAVLSAPPLELQELWNIELEQYWPLEYSPSLGDVVQHIDTTSPATWLILEASFLQQEAPNMLRLATPLKYPMHSRSADDVAYPRLKDFSLSSVKPVFRLQVLFESGFISSCALWHLVRCVALGGDVHTLMVDHLLSLSHKNKVSVLSRMVHWLIPNTREARSKEMQYLCARVGGRARLTRVLTQFLLDLGHAHEGIQYALLDAIISLVIPLLVPEMRSWAIHEDLFRRCHYFPSLKLRPSYSKDTLRLSSLIRENTLASVIRQPGSKSSQQIADVLEPIFNG
ncbi:hypothetical protein C8R45DRAFT_1221372 [Mycena sanguinolenta]|nr:hypothetical protein C8R45DRAFT_1221372 [Mycena sanguinolenta]